MHLLYCVLNFPVTGIIPHSARPPSTNQSHARLTFVAKVSVDEMVGRRKAFREEMRHFQPLVMPESMPDFIEQGQGTCRKSYKILKNEAFGDHVISFEWVIL